ncbi:MAG: MerC domain-containing protein [Acidiferrobacterales bacterium]
MTKVARDARKLEWLAGVATLLSILACYGTPAVIGTLSALGISVALHTGAWAGAISLFAVLAVAGVALGYRRHRMGSPLVTAAIGTAIILWVMFGSYSRVLELVGFGALIIAATWDWRLKQHRGAVTPAPGHR